MFLANKQDCKTYSNAPVATLIPQLHTTPRVPSDDLACDQACHAATGIARVPEDSIVGFTVHIPHIAGAVDSLCSAPSLTLTPWTNSSAKPLNLLRTSPMRVVSG